MEMTKHNIPARKFENMLHGLTEADCKSLLEMMCKKGRLTQREFLLTEFAPSHGWEAEVSYHPAGIVSGDFYDAFFLPDNRLGLVLADVCDRGVVTTLFMAITRSLLRIYGGHRQNKFSVNFNESDTVPNLVQRAVTLANDHLSHEYGHMCMFVTLFFGALDLTSGELEYVNAGHEPVYIIGENGGRKQLKAGGPALGLVPEFSFQTSRAVVNKGELILGYTDGVPEAHSPKGALFGKARLKKIVEDGRTKCPRALVASIEKELLDHMGSSAERDDISIVAIKRSDTDGAAIH